MSYIEDNGYLVFDGVKSSDYGVWISGGGTYNAAKRRYKEYEVPGRNGVLTIDEGAFEEQEVVYPAFIARDFPANVEAFRNELMSRNGYVRMTDSYHPDEYYYAKYMDGLEVDTAPGGVAGQFNLTFRRDPRRFLLAGENAVMCHWRSHNLLAYPYYDTTKDVGGVHFEDVGDGTIIASGAYESGNVYPNFAVVPVRMDAFGLLDGETYILSGCPDGGGSSTYRLVLTKHTPGTATYYDFGGGVSFAYDSNAEYSLSIYIYTRNAVDLTFKPMIRKASDTDEWIPYGVINRPIENPTLFESNPIVRVTFGGSAELITQPYYTTENPYTRNGVTFTRNQDGTITVNGTATGRAYYTLSYLSSTLAVGRYRLEGCPAGGSASSYYLCTWLYDNGATAASYRDIGGGALFDITENLSAYRWIAQIYVETGTTVNNLTFAPSLRATSSVRECQLSIGDYVMAVKNIHPYIDIDSEMQNCYCGTSNANAHVTFANDEFPKLVPGVNNVTTSIGIESVAITPRWYRV